MNTRAFDPALFAAVDACDADGGEDFTVVERCPVCGALELVFEADLGRLVDLEGNPHTCPPEDDSHASGT